MQAQPEFRKSERFGHESIIKLEDDLTLSPYYAVAYNLSEAGMYFKSLFELHPGARIHIRIDDYTFSQNPVPAKVVWCNALKNQGVFRYGVGVEFLQLVNHSGLKACVPISSRMKTSNDNEREVVIEREPRFAE
jgi:Tfp pilus assembly protein PilZ